MYLCYSKKHIFNFFHFGFQHIIDLADSNADGTLSYEEFIEVVADKA